MRAESLTEQQQQFLTQQRQKPQGRERPTGQREIAKVKKCRVRPHTACVLSGGRTRCSAPRENLGSLHTLGGFHGVGAGGRLKALHAGRRRAPGRQKGRPALKWGGAGKNRRGDAVKKAHAGRAAPRPSGRRGPRRGPATRGKMGCHAARRRAKGPTPPASPREQAGGVCPYASLFNFWYLSLPSGPLSALRFLTPQRQKPLSLL